MSWIHSFDVVCLQAYAFSQSLMSASSCDAVVEHAYTLANATQKQELLAEFYSPEFRLFKGMNTAGKGR